METQLQKLTSILLGVGLFLFASLNTQCQILVKDIDPSGSSYPFLLKNVNGTLFFNADNGTHGREPWKSDGTANGTIMVKDINPGNPSSGSIYSFQSLAINNILFFAADDGVNGWSLWKTDGTTNGTIFLKNIIATLSESECIEYNGNLLFVALDSANFRELWKSDGTPSACINQKFKMLI